jgi:hypothetical protein
VVVGRYRVRCNNLNLNMNTFVLGQSDLPCSAYISNAEKSERRSEPWAYTHREACLHRRISFIFPHLIHEMTKKWYQKGYRGFKGGPWSNQLPGTLGHWPPLCRPDHCRYDPPNLVGLAACFEITVATPVLAPSRADLPASVLFPSGLTPFVRKGPLNKARDAR